MIKDILEEENSQSVVKKPFLPEDVSKVFSQMIKIRGSFDKLSRSVAVARKVPPQDFKQPDFFPDYELHTMNNLYKADNNKDNNEDEDCRKQH